MCAWPSSSVRTKDWTTEILTDSALESQLDILHTYFNDSLNASTGHAHTGGTSNGPKITLTAAAAVQGTLPIANGGTGVATLAALLNLVYPVGSVYINVSDSTNPGTLLGFGTWVALGAGRMIVGFDSGDTSFDTAGETGGANTVTLVKGNIPAHIHGQQKNGSDGTVAGNFSAGTNASNTTAATGCDTLDGTADGLKVSPDAFSILSKYVTCYTWKRTV